MLNHLNMRDLCPECGSYWGCDTPDDQGFPLYRCEECGYREVAVESIMDQVESERERWRELNW